MYRSILVPLDGSSFSEAALPVAQNIARRADATLHLVHVHLPIISTYIEGMPILDREADAAARTAERDWLTGVHARVAATPQRATFALLEGSVAETLRTYAITHAIDLVVLTTHARGGVARTWLGSTGDALMRQCAAPVLLLHAPHAGATPPIDASFRRVLIPLDGSAAAERIVACAVDLGTSQTEYIVLLIANRPRLGSATLVHEMEVAETYLERIAAPLREAGHSVRVEIMVDRHAAARIVAEAEKQAIDLIAMTTHGRGGLTRLVMGSTADHVVRGTATPVLVLRPTNHLIDDLAPIDQADNVTATN